MQSSVDAQQYIYMPNLSIGILIKIKYTEFHHRLTTNSSFHNYQTRSRNSLKKPYIRLITFLNGTESKKYTNLLYLIRFKDIILKPYKVTISNLRTSHEYLP